MKWGVPRLCHTLPKALRGDEAGECVVGNPVRTLGIDIRAVDTELEALAFTVGIRIPHEFYRPQADLGHAPI